MTTTSPSWFPSWPSGFPDIQAAYEHSVPRQYPEGLYEQGSDEYEDLIATGVVFSWVAQGAEWVKRRIFPHLDDGAMFLGLWEGCLGVAQRATAAARQAAVVAAARYKRGTATSEKVKNIFAAIYEVTGSHNILFSYATKADIAATSPDTNDETAEALNTFHIYVEGGALEPIWDLLWDAIAICKPTWQRWGGGQYKTMKWDTEGGWDTACWGA